MGRRAAPVVPGDDLQGVVEGLAGDEQGVQVVVAVRTAPKDAETQVQFDVRVCDHTRKDNDYSTVMEVK